MIGIYKFTNKLTGEAYIGQSVDIKRRYNQHKNRYDKFYKEAPIEDTHFHSMLRHYGFHNFDFEILEECDVEKLNERETYYIAFYNSLYPNGYNRTCGGNMPHTNAIENIDTVFEIQDLLKITTLSNTELGKIYGVTDQTISDINSGRSWFNSKISYPIRNGKAIKKKHTYCVCCGKEITKGGKTNFCNNCYKLTTRKTKHRPCKEDLYNLLINNFFTYVGKMYGVSDNAVRKWCELYGIPKNAKYYRSVIC